MTREQDLERQLADWLVDGPSMAPPEVVDQALKQTDGRRQWRGAWRLLVVPLTRLGGWFPSYRTARVSALAAALAGVLLTTVLVSVPFLGGDPGPPPEMDATAPRVVAGTAAMDVTRVTAAELVRSLDLDSDDPRIDGRARQELNVLTEAGSVRQLHGTMHLSNDWGAWDGPVDIVRYPSGEEYEYASLQGSGAYEGFTYLYTVRQADAEAERTVEGAIWPDEPPSPPDPSLLP